MKSLIRGLVLATALASAAIAAEPPARPFHPSIETTKIGDLAANPATRKVLERHISGVFKYMFFVKGWSLRKLSHQKDAKLDNAELMQMQAELDAAVAGQSSAR